MQRELRRLAACGLVTVTRIGNQKHFQKRTVPLRSSTNSAISSPRPSVLPIRYARPLRLLRRKSISHCFMARYPKAPIPPAVTLISWSLATQLTLEDLYAALAAVETSLDRKVNPTLYTSKEFDQRRNAGNAFLMRVLTGKHMVLIGEEHARFATR